MKGVGREGKLDLLGYFEYSFLSQVAIKVQDMRSGTWNFNDIIFRFNEKY